MIGLNDNLLCDSSTVGEWCYMFMSFILAPNPPKGDRLGEFVKPRGRVQGEVRLPRLPFACSAGSLDRRFFTTSIVLFHKQADDRKPGKF